MSVILWLASALLVPHVRELIENRYDENSRNHLGVFVALPSFSNALIAAAPREPLRTLWLTTCVPWHGGEVSVVASSCWRGARGAAAAARPRGRLASRDAAVGGMRGGGGGVPR